MHVFRFAKNIPSMKQIYIMLKEEKERLEYRNKIGCHYNFVDRSGGNEKMCMVLAGYKPYLYNAVFGRIKKYLPHGVDMCVITSGLYSNEISAICERNHWSYLSTRENNVSLVQNIAITLHPKAEYIFKLDEDMFITKDYFEIMYQDYLKVEKDNKYNIGFLAPLIPVNGYGNMRVLEKLNLSEKYEAMFEKPKFAAGVDRMIENNPDVARFFWGEGGYVPTIDEINYRFMQQGFQYAPCPIRFSIGAVLFTRKTFTDMGMFRVKRIGNTMGVDEIQMCTYCICQSKAIIVVENVVVGHLSFGMQNIAMQEYFKNNEQLFLPR